MKRNYYLKVVHSAKGSTWEEHKYVKRIDGTYYYPKGYEGGRTVDTLEKQQEDGTAPEYTDEDIDALAMEVIRGNFANGEERKTLLGDIYQKVQDKVNSILRSSGSSSEKTTNENQSDKSEKADSKGKSAVETANEVLKSREASRSKKGPDMNKIYSIYDKKKKEAKHGVMDDPDHIEHYGVLGMKWGVRRYQNYDGSYTQKGLKRYKASEKKYDDAKTKYKTATTKAAKRSAKASMKTAKVQMNKDYDQLKRDNLADQGKRLYASGKTITSNQQFNQNLGMMTAAAAALSNVALKNTGMTYIKGLGVVPISTLTQASILAGGAALGVGMEIKTARENKRLRAYYAH